jgi:tetratricopeptide (TPR) repeat protein
MDKKWLKPALVVGLGLVLMVLFLWMPRKPNTDEAQQNMPALSSEESRLQKAIELVNGPNPMQGIMMLREIVAKDTNNVEAHYWLGVFAVQSGQYDKAIPRFEKVLRLEPNYINAYMDLGAVYKELGEKEKALTLFESAVQRDSSNVYALFFSGETSADVGQNDKAKKYYTQLLRHTADTAVVVRVKERIEKLK